MKIQGPGSSQAASKTKKSGKASGSSGNFGDFMTESAHETAGAGATRSIAHVDSLLAVQGAEDPTERAARQKARQRGKVILDELDKIRVAMLSGTLTIGHMMDIADVVAGHRQKITDPVLTRIMDEIDLRAQVELAKMRVAMDKKNGSTGGL